MHGQYFNEWATNAPLGKTNPLKPPEATLAEIQAIEEPESGADSAASAVDKCCKKIQDPGKRIELIHV